MPARHLLLIENRPHTASTGAATTARRGVSPISRRRMRRVRASTEMDARVFRIPRGRFANCAGQTLMLFDDASLFDQPDVLTLRLEFCVTTPSSGR